MATGKRRFGERRFVDEGDSPIKRRRSGADAPHQSEEERLSSLISKLGDQYQQLETHINSLSEVLKDEYPSFRDNILKTILQSVYEKPEKVSVYSTLAGLLNTKQSKIGEEVLDVLIEEIKSALSSQNFNKVQLLVRFLADLVNTHVVDVDSIIEVFDTLLAVKFELNIPQTRSDWFIYCVMSALPWVGFELFDKNRENLDRVMGAIEEYINKRDKSYIPAVQVVFSEQEHDYLDVLMNQLKSLNARGWKESLLLRPYAQFSRYLSEGKTHKFPELSVPKHSEEWFYPTPFIPMKIFTEEEESLHSLPPSHSIERHLAEDAVRMVLLMHCNDRKDTVFTLIQQIERVESFSMAHIAVEVLMGHVLQLPSAPNIPAFYGAVISGLCKQKPTVVPVILNRVVHFLFQQVTSMNPVCVNRLAQWFGYHLGNWKFEWEWNLWSMVLQLAQDHPKVRFIREVLAKCLRLSYFEHVQDNIPVQFHALLPPQPTDTFSYEQREGESRPEVTVANLLLTDFNEKCPPADLLGTLDKLDNLCPAAAPKDLQNAKIEIFTQSLLYFGNKSLTHCFSALFKYRPLLLSIVKSPECKIVCVKAVGEFLQSKPQWMQLVINKLVRMQVVDPASVISWIFLPNVVSILTRSFVWEIIDSVIHIGHGMYIKACKELKQQKDELTSYSDLEQLTHNEEDRKEVLEKEMEEFERKVEDADQLLGNTFLVLCQSFVSVLSQHLSGCQERKQDARTQWYLCVLAGLQHILLKYSHEVYHYMNELEGQVFIGDLYSDITQVYHRFQILTC